MSTAAVSFFCKRVGAKVRELGFSRKCPSHPWFTAHMAAATRAILDRISLVDFIVEVRDARAPLSSALEQLEEVTCSNKRIILLNKVDLADRYQTEKWVKFFQQQRCYCYPVNAHNQESIKGLLNFIRAKVRELEVDESFTATLMLVGVPNVGKSAIINAMHHIGRISAAEKGKLKHALVTSQPGETKDISSFKIASHPNIYVLDTPGILPPEIPHDQSGARLALIGTLSDCLVGELELVRYFLAILNSGDRYKRWEKLNVTVDDAFGKKEEIVVASSSEKRRRKQHHSDHTQDHIVKDVRYALFKTASSFKGNMESEIEMAGLIDKQFMALHQAFRVSLECGVDGNRIISEKLINLYRTGRLGRHTLDHLPNNLI